MVMVVVVVMRNMHVVAATNLMSQATKWQTGVMAREALRAGDGG